MKLRKIFYKLSKTQWKALFSGEITYQTCPMGGIFPIVPEHLSHARFR
jgi:hypothetical protein